MKNRYNNYNIAQLKNINKNYIETNHLSDTNNNDYSYINLNNNHNNIDNSSKIKKYEKYCNITNTNYNNVIDKNINNVNKNNITNNSG